MKKAKRKLKIKQVRKYLEEINHHCAQLSTTLRDLADKLDAVRSYHLDNEE